jgi:cobalt-zinc-cadmium efflux system membrane fusion protein
MKMYARIEFRSFLKCTILLAFMLAAVTWLGGAVWAEGDHDDHDHETADTTVSDHAEGVADDDHDHDHEGDADEAAHDDADGHDDHDDELAIELSPEAMKMAGISLSKVTRGRIEQCLELPGEVGFNEDRLVHIAPRFAGIALKANVRVGDRVTFGDVVAVVESNESMSAYSIKAPISGWVISRHITPGEYVSEENSIYVIADLSTVWVNLAVYPKDANRIKKGQAVDIDAVGSDMKASGKIEYVSPVMDYRTRSLTARVVLTNMDHTWRPGTFVHAMVTSEDVDEGLVVDKSAVQYLDGKSVVFVADGANRFRPAEIVIGSRNARHVRVLSGLEIGMEYVAAGAFELKAQVVTSSMDAHAGHTH